MKPARTEIAPGIFTLDPAAHQLKRLLSERDRAVKEIAGIDAQMMLWRRRYADDRGERMLPTIERLRRELFPSGHNQ